MKIIEKNSEIKSRCIGELFDPKHLLILRKINLFTKSR